MVGSTIGRSLAFWLGDVPTIGIHHMEAHLLPPMLEEKSAELSVFALLVSGGHTLLVEVNKIGQYRILGESLDDAVS